MGLENCELIDAIGTEDESGLVVLTILDSWTWEDEGQHLIALQNKINAYLGFVETEQIYQEYPSAKGRNLRIDLISKYMIPGIGLGLLGRASEVASQLNITIEHKMH